jgi:hypothetical protein
MGNNNYGVTYNLALNTWVAVGTQSEGYSSIQYSYDGSNWSNANTMGNNNYGVATKYDTIPNIVTNYTSTISTFNTTYLSYDSISTTYITTSTIYVNSINDVPTDNISSLVGQWNSNGNTFPNKGDTGVMGPAISYIEGNQPYAPPGSLLTTTVGATQTAIYQVGPVTSLATTKFLIIANTSFTTDRHGVELTVGRATSNNATAATSVNIVTNATPLVLPATTTAYYMAAYAAINQSMGPVNLNGTAIDAPGAGSFYYTIWMQSSPSHNYTTMTAFLTVLKIQP